MICSRMSRTIGKSNTNWTLLGKAEKIFPGRHTDSGENLHSSCANLSLSNWCLGVFVEIFKLETGVPQLQEKTARKSLWHFPPIVARGKLIYPTISRRKKIIHTPHHLQFNQLPPFTRDRCKLFNFSPMSYSLPKLTLMGTLGILCGEQCYLLWLCLELPQQYWDIRICVVWKIQILVLIQRF